MNDTIKQGIIIKGVGGFYYVETANCIYECKARGKFRKEKISPLPGDHVMIEVDAYDKGVITEILERKNFLIRPRVANLNKLFIVASMQDPSPNTLIIDKTIAIAEKKQIEPILIITKTDLKPADSLFEIYKRVGIKIVVVSPDDLSVIDSIKELIKDSVTAFTGNSGVGKSTLLNLIDQRLALPTGDISKKLGRGRHTTRQVELYKLDKGGYVADTPGFSAIDIEKSEIIMKDELQHCFREFADLIDQCKFTGCSHTCETGCKIIEAVENGTIHKNRHENYIAMYNEVKNIKDWEIQN